MSKLLTGKVAVITGATRGIGKAIALAMAAEGAHLAILHVSEPEEAESAVSQIKSLMVNAQSYFCDITDYDRVKKTVDQIIAEFGTIDILVNNAGITCDKLVLQMTEADFDQVIDINLKGSFNMIRHTFHHFMRRKAGSIINISSIAGIMGNIGQANYSASKAGLIGLTKSIAKELASRNITCNAIAPGFIDTEMTKILSEGVRKDTINAIPLKRMGNPDDIASLAVFLASEKSRYITGEIIKVDGGLYI